MPPEQWSQPHLFHGSGVGPHSDVYALGCLLYELIAGCLPFDAETWPELCRMHLEVTPTPPRRHNSAIPVALEALVMKTMEKLPPKRVQSMDDVIAALGGDADGKAGKPTLEQQLDLLKDAADSPAKEQALKDLTAAHPVRTEGYLALAGYYNRAQRTDKAAAVWRQASEKMPKSGPVFGALGAALKQSGDPAAAVRAFSRALELDLPEKERDHVENMLKDLKGSL